jgi:catechol 2,3-dioxygenase-like lactoylglutathione lyase family enzyme
MGSSHDGLMMLSGWISGITSHIGVTVPTLEEGRAFYCGLLGFEETATYESRGAFMDEITGIPDVVARTAMLSVPGGMRLQMQEWEPKGAPQTYRHNNPGVTHISWGVQDVQAEYERLGALGVAFRCAPVPIDFADRSHPMNGWTVTYFDDPWGLPLELLGPTPGATPRNGEVAGSTSP